MRRWFRGLLILGLAALPSSAPAQYAAPRYYYPPNSYPGWNGYGGGYGYPQYYGASAGWGQPRYNYVPTPYMALPQSAPTMTMTRPRMDGDPLVPPQNLPDKVESPSPITSTSGEGGGLLGRRLKSTPDLSPTPDSENATPLPLLASPMPSDGNKTAAPAPAAAAPIMSAPPASACGAGCGGGCGLDCKECKEKAPKFLAFGDYLYWNVHGADVPFAQAFDGTDPFNSVPRGSVGVDSPHFTNGFRAGAGFAIGEDSWLVGTFTWFRDSTTASISAPDTDVLHNFLVFPNTVNSAGDSLTASANYAIQLYTADVDYKCAFVNTDHVTLSWLAGARYGHLEQSFLANYEIFGTTTVESHINFDGGGPRGGLEGQWRICKGIFGYGQGVVDLLAGRFDSTYEERNVFTGLVGQTSIDSSRIVPITELELGAGWQSPKGHILVSAGYYVGAWFNTVTTTTLAQSITNTNFTTNGNNFRDTLVFDGFVGRLEIRY